MYLKSKILNKIVEKRKEKRRQLSEHFLYISKTSGATVEQQHVQKVLEFAYNLNYLLPPPCPPHTGGTPATILELLWSSGKQKSDSTHAPGQFNLQVLWSQSQSHCHY